MLQSLFCTISSPFCTLSTCFWTLLEWAFLRILWGLAVFCFFQCFSSCFKFLILKIKKCKAIFPQLCYARVSLTRLYRIIWADRLRSMMIKVNWFGRWSLTFMAEYGKIRLTINNLFHSGNWGSMRMLKRGFIITASDITTVIQELT